MPTSKYYCFTYFKFPEKLVSYCERLSELDCFQYIIAQIEESPKTGRLHIQGYIEFSKNTAMKTIKNILPGVHLEIKKGTREQAREYCRKTETSVCSPLEIGVWIPSIQGKRNDLKLIKNLIKENVPIEVIINNNCTNYQQIRMTEKLMQYSKNTPRNPNEPPEIIWIYGPTGTGKTSYVYREYSDIYTTLETSRWWDGYSQQETILIDDMRKDFCKFHVLLRLLDRYPFKVQYKGGTRHINSKYIIITSCYHPKQMYDTREDIKQLIRRISLIKYIGPPEKEFYDYLSDDEN
jgi:hypothetical protein